VTLPRFALLAVTLAAATATQAAVWVSADGDDRNPGTEEKPLGTLVRARDMVRTLNRDMSDDITVFISGSYRLSQPVEFGPDDSGTNGYSVVYTAAPGEHPVISGAVRIAGWSIADKARNLWSAPAPAGLEYSRELFVDGARASVTRGRPAPVAIQSQIPLPPVDPSKEWKNPADIVYPARDPDGIWSERPGMANAIVENAFELLGRPGEWYFDRTARRIYYVPRAGEDLARADVEAAEAAALIVGAGSGERPLTGLVFKGIRFEFATRSPEAGQGKSQGAAVRFRLAGAIQFLEDEFVHMGPPALDLGPGFAGGNIEACVFGDISSAALRASSASGLNVSESRFSYVATEDHHGGAIELSHCEGVSIAHSQVDHFPGAAMLSDGGVPDAGQLGTDLLSLPMIGSGSAAPPVPESPDAGITAPYSSLLEERISPPAPPNPPEAVSADPENAFAYVTWEPPCIDGGSPVALYTIAASTGGTMTISAADFLQKGYVIFPGLENGTGVAFTVAATNANGASLPSAASATVTPTHRRKLKVPQPPASASVMLGVGGSTLRIEAPEKTGGSPVIAYSLSVIPDGAITVLEGRDVIHCDATHPLSRWIPGFTPQPGATVAVTATNSLGEGKPALAVVQR
jgi:hypothetical protein